MSKIATGQINASAADVYDAFFLPALFAQWPPRLSDRAELSPGQTVLDVACGSGAFAREARQRVLPGGTVTGLDCNPDMLAVARRRTPDIDWRHGRAEALPFDDQRFDVVACQFGLMFFDDQTAALRQMWRVLRPGGRLTVAVWDSAERSPGYAAMIALLQRLFGAAVAAELRAPFNLGDPNRLRALFSEAGIGHAELDTVAGSARFPSLDAWLHTEIKGWTLADRIDDAQYRQLCAEARGALKDYVRPDGKVRFAAPAHIAIARKTC